MDDAKRWRLDELIAFAERHGEELAITLVVGGGVTIDGILTPYRRYEHWFREVMSRAMLTGDRHLSLPAVEMPAISKAEAEAVRAHWIEDGWRPEAGEVPTHFAVRNARLTGMPLVLPYLVVKTEAVVAFSPVSLYLS